MIHTLGLLRALLTGSVECTAYTNSLSCLEVCSDFLAMKMLSVESPMPEQMSFQKQFKSPAMNGPLRTLIVCQPDRLNLDNQLDLRDPRNSATLLGYTPTGIGINRCRQRDISSRALGLFVVLRSVGTAA